MCEMCPPDPADEPPEALHRRPCQCYLHRDDLRDGVQVSRYELPDVLPRRLGECGFEVYNRVRRQIAERPPQEWREVRPVPQPLGARRALPIPF